ncbi:hypothetical protein SAMN05216421_2506 [Halopseudomonas xinjiangensis]|uniref:Uncharacterized protein n=1 Tax=Halopseudomonas xinjiangensis TaxID=487184 RepID=A0A1H1W972_9GAMM|nr:hypothetical protein [Halopseudomonas xinjiangensis]SDS93190.1 hypothetical protein SAMN05216421_2506 [Halopseudomonas xinjiangensis]
MPDYFICCNDATDRDCLEHVRVRLDIIDLTEEQLDAIEQGQPFPVSREQVEASGLQLDAKQTEMLAEQGWVSWRVDIDAVCDPCATEAD